MSFFHPTERVKKIGPKILIFILILPVFFLAHPQKSRAQIPGLPQIVVDVDTEANTTDIAANTTVSAATEPVNTSLTLAQKIKSYVLDPLAVMAARMIIQRLTAETVNWINSGFNGNPAYVKDPGQFFLGVADNTAAAYISSKPFLNSLCSPFSANVRLALVKNYLSETQYSSCTLGALANNYNSFVTNFNQGGWDAWFNVTQNTQSNPYGQYLDAKNQLALQVGNQTTKYQTQLTQGNGFLSYEKCDPKKASTYSFQAGGTQSPNFTGPVQNTSVADAQSRWDSCSQAYSSLSETDIEGVCGPNPSKNPSASYTPNARDGSVVDGSGTTACDPRDMQTVTPGSVISAQLNKVLPSAVDELQLTTSINTIVSSLLTEMFSKAIGATGLGGLSQSGSGSSSGTGGSQAALLAQLANSTAAANNTTGQVTQGILNTTDPNLKSAQPTPAGSPFIILNPPNPATATSIASFIDPGEEAYDAAGNNISSNIVTTTSAGSAGSGGSQTYTISYDVTDTSGKKANTVTRTVKVTVPPAKTPPTSTTPGGNPNNNTNTSGNSNSTSALGPTDWVPNASGQSSIPEFPSGISALSYFTTAAPDPASGAACTANLSSKFQANPGDLFVDGHTETQTYCGVCMSTNTVTCSGQHYQSCSITFTNTTNPSCVPATAGTSGNTSSSGGASTQFSVTPTFLNYTVTGGQTSASQAIVIKNTAPGGVAMRWAILKTSTWMLASPNDDGGTLANGQSITINLSASAAFLPHFTYTGTVEVNGYDATTQNTLGSFSIPVNLTVN